ncbi:MAG: hypothetical protein CM1200mP5_7090 [Candidatus Pelagibacterales bacterium]|nr:MAG: hypothetical protein CM1200mP5_7090 [Pelagibacterales bacterium]
MALGISMIGASEGLMLAKKLNIDIKKVHEIMKSASGNSWPISVYPPLPGLKKECHQIINIVLVFLQA